MNNREVSTSRLVFMQKKLIWYAIVQMDDIENRECKSSTQLNILLTDNRPNQQYLRPYAISLITTLWLPSSLS